MIRFIDLRGQGTEHRFAFWDTVTSAFLRFDGGQAWDVWDGDCADAISRGPIPADSAATLERLRGLCPEWVFVSDGGAHEERFWSESENPKSIHDRTAEILRVEFCIDHMSSETFALCKAIDERLAAKASRT